MLWLALRKHFIFTHLGDGLGLKDDLMDLIAGIQGRRLDEQRASLPCLPSLPGLNSHTATGQDIFKRLSVASAASVTEKTFPDDDFFDQLMRCQVRYTFAL